MDNNSPILSICIPTWNRSRFLSKSLESFLSHLKEIDSSELELYVSDNCSDDDTTSVVNHFKNLGLPITYNRNSENIGAAGNFLKCMNWASGKYILLLGDDDILKPGSVKIILDLLRGKDYGLVHIHDFNEGEKIMEYTNSEDFLMKISYWITFMSGSIFRKDIVPQIDSSKYIGTHLLQMPYYVSSALSKKTNLLVTKSILESGLDSSSNGGYNFYEVFVQNYLEIWKEFLNCHRISIGTFEYIKKHIYCNFVIYYNYNLLFRHRNVQDENVSYIGNRNGFKIAGAKDILKKYYKGNWYCFFMKYKYVKCILKDLLKRN